MKKEVIIAIIIGFAIGLVITFGIYRAQQSLNLENTSSPEPNTNIIIPTSPPETAPDITVASPENGSLIDTSQVRITGTTTPQALLSFIGSKDATTANADKQGNFSSIITLFEGVNSIIIESYDSAGNKSTETITLIFLPETNSISSTPNPSAIPD